MEKFDLERSDLHRFACLDINQLGFHAHPASVELVFDQSVGERCGVDWRVDIFKQMTNSAGVVFVTVGDDNALHLVSALFDIFKIGNDVIDADHVIVREHHAGVHDQDLLVVFVDRHVFAHLAQTAEGDDT